MDQLRVLLVDDEPLARLRLRGLVESIGEPPACIVGEAGRAAEADKVLAEQTVDVVLLDIAMPGVDGLALAARWREQPGGPAVVFVTAHAEHAVGAFEIEAVDYLTKPVRRERLQAALQRVAQRRRAQPEPAASTPVLVVSDRGRTLRVPLDEIVYLRAELKYVTLRTATHVHVLDDALADLEQRLGAGFLRIHRNAIVALGAVRALQRRRTAGGDADAWAVRVAPGDEWLAVSRRQLAAVREVLGGTG